MYKKALMLSLKTKWARLILDGRKTIEIRKTAPIHLFTPFKCYIYETKMHLPGRITWDGKPADIGGKVIGECIVDRIEPFDGLQTILNLSQKEHHSSVNSLLRDSCVSPEELQEYLMKKPSSNENIGVQYADGYAWHISNVKTYNTPLDIANFKKIVSTRFGWTDERMERAPQSWCYVEDRGI